MKRNSNTPSVKSQFFIVLALLGMCGTTLYAAYHLLTQKTQTPKGPVREIAVLGKIKYRFQCIYSGTQNMQRSAGSSSTAAPAFRSSQKDQIGFSYAGAPAPAKRVITYADAMESNRAAVAANSAVAGKGLHLSSSAETKSLGGGGITNLSMTNSGTNSAASNYGSTYAVVAPALTTRSSRTIALAANTTLPTLASSTESDLTNPFAAGPRRISYVGGTAGFPESPTPGQEYESGGVTYYWNPETNQWETDEETTSNPGDPMPVGGPLLPLLLFAVVGVGARRYKMRFMQNHE